MKHIQVVSIRKPVRAEQWVWVEWKQIFGPKPIDTTQARWLAAVVDMALQK